MTDEKANIFKVPGLPGSHGRGCGGHKGGGQCALPGDVSGFAIKPRYSCSVKKAPGVTLVFQAPKSKKKRRSLSAVDVIGKFLRNRKTVPAHRQCPNAAGKTDGISCRPE